MKDVKMIDLSVASELGVMTLGAFRVIRSQLVQL